MTVNRCEEGDRPIRVSEAVALAGIFSIPLSKLLEPPTPPEEEEALRRLDLLQRHIVDLEAHHARLGEERAAIAMRAAEEERIAHEMADRVALVMEQAREAEIKAAELNQRSSVVDSELRRISAELEAARAAWSYEMENSLALRSRPVTLAPEDLLAHLDDVTITEDQDGQYYLEMALEEGRGGIQTGPHASREAALEHYRRMLSDFVHWKESQQAERSGSASQAPLEHAAPRTGKFVLKKDAAGQFRFTLHAPNGKVLATSEAFASKADALQGIAVVKRAANPKTETVDS